MGPAQVRRPRSLSLLKEAAAQTYGRFSPNGRWIAYRSGDPANGAIRVAPFPGPGGRWQIAGAGDYPRWRRDGKELFYVNTLDASLMAVPITERGDSIEAGEARALFSRNLRTLGYPYDVSADGQRFLVNVAAEQAAEQHITLVVNWTAGLKH